MLLKLIKDEKPDHVAVVFDTKEPTFRDELYDKYKANRPEPPDDLVQQFEYFQPITEALNIRSIAKAGFEADDIIGTLAIEAEKKGYEVVIVTGDKDFMQLVNDHITIYDTMKDLRIGRDEVKKKFGVEPSQVIDVMSLIGDTSDNVPGVSGIGDKTAAALINQFKSLDDLLENYDKVSNKRAMNALKNGAENAKLSRELVTIKKDVSLELSVDDLKYESPKYNCAKELFTKLEFYKLLLELFPEAGADKKTVNTSVVKTPAQLIAFLIDVNKSEGVGLYCFPDVDNSILGIGVCLSDGSSKYLPIGHQTLEEVPNLDLKSVEDFLKGIKIKTYYYDFKEQVKRLNFKLNALMVVQDVKLMAYVLNSSYPLELTMLNQHILGEHINDLGLLDRKKKKKVATFHDIATLTSNLAIAVFNLGKKLEVDLEKDEKLNKIYKELEMPLASVLLKMEKFGVKVDTPELARLSEEYAKRMKVLETAIYLEATEEFNINSPKQLAHVLFETLGLPVIKKTKTGYSTDSKVLKELSKTYNITKLILEYRSLSKLKSTYIDVLPVLANKNTSRIHTTFNQALTATGRLSSSEPNLQNVPARTEDGLKIRRTFIADKGMKLMSADYSQIELRIMAHICDEPYFVDGFKKGVDIHSATAAKIFGVDDADVDSRMRGIAKTVNFGVLYGQSAYGLSEQLDIDVNEADSYIKEYYAAYPKIVGLREEILEKTKKLGYVETILGRRRYIPDINSSNRNVRGFAERTAFNAVFQGTAADIIKMAMIKIENILESDYPDIHLLLQVHDELVFEVPNEKLYALEKIVVDNMCNVADLKIPLKVDVGIGNNWAECK